jgi:peptide chain release factor 2
MMPGGFFDLASKERELLELKEVAADPDLWSDPDHARDITRKIARYERLIGSVTDLQEGVDDAEVFRELLAPEGDEAGLTEVASDLAKVETQVEVLEIESLFFEKYDDHNAIVTVHAGAGGVDAQDWTEILLRGYLRFLEDRGFKVQVEEVTDGDQAGLKSASFSVEGDYAYGTMLAEKGVHRLVRMSPFDSAGRRHTSFAAVDVVPEVDASEVGEIRPDDLRIDTFRSQGAGGQHVNTTDSAVRITHLPTGVVVACQAERSQIQNRARAMVTLRAKLAEKAREDRQAEIDKVRGVKHEASWGRQIRSYTMQPFQLVKDLRSGLEVGNIHAVLDGDFQPFVEAFLHWRRGEREKRD